MREFVSTREKCCFSTLLECTYKFPSASITQHSKRTSFIFLLQNKPNKQAWEKSSKLQVLLMHVQTTANEIFNKVIS